MSYEAWCHFVPLPVGGDNRVIGDLTPTFTLESPLFTTSFGHRDSVPGMPVTGQKHALPDRPEGEPGLPGDRRTARQRQVRGQPARRRPRSKGERGRCTFQVRFNPQHGRDIPVSSGRGKVTQSNLIGNGHDDQVLRLLMPDPGQVVMVMSEGKGCVSSLGDLQPGGEIGADGDVEPVLSVVLVEQGFTCPSLVGKVRVLLVGNLGHD